MPSKLLLSFALLLRLALTKPIHQAPVEKRQFDGPRGFPFHPPSDLYLPHGPHGPPDFPPRPEITPTSTDLTTTTPTETQPSSDASAVLSTAPAAIPSSLFATTTTLFVTSTTLSYTCCCHDDADGYDYYVVVGTGGVFGARHFINTTAGIVHAAGIVNTAADIVNTAADFINAAGIVNSAGTIVQLDHIIVDPGYIVIDTNLILDTEVRIEFSCFDWLHRRSPVIPSTINVERHPSIDMFIYTSPSSYTIWDCVGLHRVGGREDWRFLLQDGGKARHLSGTVHAMESSG
ncbi:hypothetical protein LTR09_002375 [Extremus antarcticus]|uniref:Uncharacterized protein n=1 Tax=Extremus antarcticus TaxID=702011 RepID=A0AAJ0GFJ8_9PEZI|nr:hypothetical protein LTR09_002375 [Extremus antarcticus]